MGKEITPNNVLREVGFEDSFFSEMASWGIKADKANLTSNGKMIRITFIGIGSGKGRGSGYTYTQAFDLPKISPIRPQEIREVLQRVNGIIGQQNPVVRSYRGPAAETQRLRA